VSSLGGGAILRGWTWLGSRATPVVAGLVLLTGCGGGVRRLDASVPTRLTIAVTEPSPGRFRYFAPTSVAAGLVQIQFTNGGRMSHKAQLWRVGGGHTVDEALRVQRDRGAGPLPAWVVAAGGVGATSPGDVGQTVQRLAPGRYYVGGHARERGTVAQITVNGGMGGRAIRLPSASAQVTAHEYGFRMSGLRAGRRWIEFRNVGAEPHQAYFVPIRESASPADVRSALAGRRIEPPPIDLKRARDTAVVEGGDEQVTEFELSPGRYALLCFVRDRAGGPSHLEKGMASVVMVR